MTIVGERPDHHYQITTKGGITLFSRYSRKISGYVVLAAFFVLQTSAQQPESVPARLTTPDGTPIRLRLAENVSSAHAHKGDRLNFVVVRDVNLDGLTVSPAGTTAQGSVTSVRHKRLMGIGGRLSLKVDSLTLADGDEVSLRAS